MRVGVRRVLVVARAVGARKGGWGVCAAWGGEILDARAESQRARGRLTRGRDSRRRMGINI